MKRKLLTWTAVIAIATLFGLATAEVVKKVENRHPKAKYIFLFIGDGMGSTHVATTESYLSYKAGKMGGEMLTFSSFPAYGYATTYPADYHITCSSAAGTAIACGAKTKNFMVGMGPDSVALKSIAYELKDEGYKIGILTNVPVNHATPAAFYAHNCHRDNYYEISKDIASSGFDFFGGAGFIDNFGINGDLPASDMYLAENGYSIGYGLEEFNKVSKGAEKVILCQAQNKGKSAPNYSPEYRIDGALSLSQILKTAIDYLGDEEPFFIMSEGGNLDWAGHFHHTMAMVEEVIDFDKAIKTALEFYEKHPDETLIVVTADHETGGLTLGCTSEEYHDKMIRWELLEKQWKESGCKNVLSKKENDKLNILSGIGWTSETHNGGPVPVYAIGCGSERFNGRMDNTDIKSKILGNNIK